MAALLEGETRALLTRLDRVKPFVLHETMVPAAAPAPTAQAAIESYLARGRRDLRRHARHYLAWLAGPGRAAPAEEMQRRYVAVRRRFNDVLAQLDVFHDALTQRSENTVGVWLAGLDAAAADALHIPGTPVAVPPVVCYLDRGPGAAIRRANTRIPGNGRTPVALVRIPRERMVGHGIGASLVHEAGHQVAALLGLVQALRVRLYDIERRSRSAADRAAFAAWGRWISEIVADLWCVGKLGLAGTLGLMAVVSLPRAFVLIPAPQDPHPFPYIRVRLSCALGDALYPHPQWAGLAALWSSCYPPERAPAPVRRLIGALEATMPRLAVLLRDHRPPALGGATLGQALPLSSRTPELLLAHHREWTRHPALMRGAPPTLVFAVLGQARAASRISPEAESRLLGSLITGWALSGTLTPPSRGVPSWPTSVTTPNGSRRAAGSG
ncbi:hypothetical protein [Streptomyces sp. NRRL S-118]|uniref:hypothetical protein n=1 Tax=Streptomyces sp. NRRL S-118 TaxID=1463881 RepID=UPI001F1DD691|nr:hypothetical protein [Streptomyces sp. NRRL S-118]